MRVGWDARILVNGQLRGMGSYATHILSELRRCRPEYDFRLYVDDGKVPLSLPGFSASRIGPLRGYRWQWWERLGLPFHAYKDGCDILHSPANTTPPRSAVPRVVTLHDAMPFLPWNDSPHRLHYLRVVQRHAIQRADAVITVSEYSRHDINEALGVDLGRIVVVPNAGSPEIQRPDEATIAARLAAMGVSSPFVLALGAVDKRKNTAGTLRAFAEFHRSNRDVSLALTGITPPLQTTLADEMKRLGVPSDAVRLLGFVDLPDLSALYAGCDAFLFLSLYEGFGIPILDAMQCGAPVICSNRTSCPEVAGDAAVQVEPESTADAAAAIESVLRRSAAAKDEWRRRGVARAAEFSWRHSAELTANVYENLV